MEQNIWCLFHIAKDYNQPKNNLICWWSVKPTPTQIANKMEIGLQYEGATERVNNVLNGREEDGYRLEEVKECKRLV